MNKTLCIIPCGDRKIWNKTPNIGPTQAKNVYIGPFARKCKEYAEKFYPFSWCILSAKYGFLFPKDIVLSHYDVSFNDKRTNPITTKHLLNQIVDKHLKKYKRIVVVGGRNYSNIVKEVFSKKDIHTPLSNCKGIGYMMGALNQAIQRGTPL